MSEPLLPSQKDTVHLCAAAEDRFLDLCGTYERVKGEQLPIPQSIQSAMVHWRKMIARYKQSDFRNTVSELKALKEFCQWTLDVNNEIRNQPKQTLNWAM